MIILLRLALYLGIILLFVVMPPLMLGFVLARNLSWWTKHDKVKDYVTVKSPKLSRLLVKWCHGYFTNIPKWSLLYCVNAHPHRLSILGAIDHVIVSIISLFWAYHMVGYFFFSDVSNHNIPLAIILLTCHAVVAFALSLWNKQHRRPSNTMTRAEWNLYKKRL